MDKYEPPYSVDSKIIELISSISENIGKISNFKNLDKQPHLRNKNHVKSIYSSCAIEANSLSLDEVTSIINGRKVIGKESEVIEIKNIHEAYKALNSFDPFSVFDLIKAHDIIVDNLDEKGFRKHAEGVVDENGFTIHIAPPKDMVPSLMNDLFAWMKTNFNKVHPLIVSSIFHYEFVFIHPFGNGNGRTARLWQTLLLSKWKPIFEYIPVENEIYKNAKRYYNVIKESNKIGSCSPFIVFMLEMINSSLLELQKDIRLLGNSISKYMEKLIDVVPPNKYFSSKEILLFLNLKSKENLRKNYIDPCVELGIIEVLYPDKPSSKNQRYLIKRRKKA